MLNGKTATATALIMFNLGTLGVVGKQRRERHERRREVEGREEGEKRGFI